MGRKKVYQKCTSMESGNLKIKGNSFKSVVLEPRNFITGFLCDLDWLKLKVVKLNNKTIVDRYTK